MKIINTMKTIFPSRSINEAFARNTVACFATQADPTLDEIADIKTAVSEAVTNCIVHAYKNTQGLITITANLYDDNSFSVSIKDKGCGINDIKTAMQPLYTTGGEERAGLGFSVMESYMDKVKVRSVLGKGTNVTLMKKLCK